MVHSPRNLLKMVVPIIWVASITVSWCLSDGYHISFSRGGGGAGMDTNERGDHLALPLEGARGLTG